MTYIREQLNLSFGHHSMRITYTQPSDSMALDRVTVTSLELLENIRPTKFKGSTLFGILNSTRTPQGRRLLRSSLLQPSTDEKQIAERYDAVEELVANEELFLELGKLLRGLLQIDIERVAMWVSSTLLSSSCLSSHADEFRHRSTSPHDNLGCPLKISLCCQKAIIIFLCPATRSFRVPSRS